MKITRLILYFSVVFFAISANAQTITLQPDAASGKDATVKVRDSGGSEGTTNYATDVDYKASRTTSGGNWYKTRGLLQFDLTQIPKNAFITSATLTLTGINHVYASSNAATLSRVTGPWEESTVTWNTQPPFTLTSQIPMTASTSSTHVYNVDVKAHVQDMIKNPDLNYGWLVKSNGESPSTAVEMYFASSDYTADPTKRPKLVITYLVLNIKQTAATTTSSTDGALDLTVIGGTTPYTYSWVGPSSFSATTQDISSRMSGTYTVTVTDNAGKTATTYAFLGAKVTNTLSVQPDPTLGSDAGLTYYDNGTIGDNSYGHDVNFKGFRWTNGGVWFKQRALVSFDLSSIPPSAIITEAKLYLYGLDHASTGQSNASTLQRVSSPWSEGYVTWNTKPSASSTGEIALAQSSTSTQNYTVVVTNHVQNMVKAPETNFGWMLKLNGDANNSYARMVFASSDYTTDAAKRPKLEITFYVPIGEELRNWVDEESFDNNGNVNSKTRSYVDDLGRNNQTQSLDIANGNVLATNNVFDAFGRPSLETLPAPIYQTGVFYKDKLITDGSANNYSYDDFDKVISSGASGEINNPISVNNSTQGTVGWYYSDNNSSEAYVPASSFPYTRVEYYNDPLFRVKRSSSAGSSHKMGSGHENKSFYMSSGGELFYAYGYKSSYILGFDQSSPEYKACDNLNAYKKISLDPDGKEMVSYTNGAGQLIATCLSGTGSSCVAQKVSQTMFYHGERGVTVHLPASKKQTLKLTIPGEARSRYVNAQENYSTNPQQVYYYITDLTNGKLLQEGPSFDYTINYSTRAVTFVNSYATGSGYFRISFDYTPTYISERFDPNYSCGCPKVDGYHRIPDLMVEYELDYSDWTLNYYDKAGNAVKTVSSQALDCTYDPITNNTVTTVYSTRTITVSNSCTTPLHTITTTPVSLYDQALAVEVKFSGGIPGCPGGPGYYYRHSSISDGSSVKSFSSLGNEENADQAFVESYSDTVGSSSKYLITAASRPPNNHSRYEYRLQINLCNNSGIQVAPTQDLNLNGTQIAVDFYVPAVTMATSSSVKVKLFNIFVDEYKYNTTFNQYNYYTTHNYVYGANTDWDDALCHYNLGITSKLQKYPTPNQINNALALTATYNKLNQPYAKSSQDEGLINTIYDTEGKIRFSQNAKQLNSAGENGKFTFFVYDRAGRLLETGEYNPTLSGGTKLVFQPYTTAGGVPTAPSSGTSVHAVVDNSAADWATNYEARSTQQTYNTYDLPQSDFPSSPTGLSSYSQKYKDGKVVKSYNKVAGTTLGTTWYGYDDLNRATWVVRSITGLGTKSLQYSYTKEGLLDKTDYQAETSGERFVHKYLYDANSRLSETKTSFDNSSFTSNQILQYYLHGALKRSELGGTLQGLDYVYTINNQLKSVNDPTLTNRDPGKDSYTGSHSGFYKDVFGYTLDYFTGDYARTNSYIETYTPNTGAGNTALPELYGGTIRATRWQTSIPTAAVASSTFTSGMLQYVYKYDNRGQLSEAIFGGITNSSSSSGNGLTSATGGMVGSVFNQETNAYRVDNITYDKIGNLQSLTRQGKPTATVMDQFTYVYDATIKNRLTSITDLASGSTYTDDIKTQSSNNYVYNSIGQLTKDVLADYNYAYDVYGHLISVTRTSPAYNVETFEYNEAGLRQKKISYNPSGVPTTTTWYVYDAVGALVSTYESTTQKEVIVKGAGRLGTYLKSSSYYVYELSDHLGNVRATVRNNSGVEVLNFTDYYPHGSAMPGRNYVSSAYRFAYQGQEKDTETGFMNFELRQYDPRIGRWFNPDPMGQYYSPYLAMGNNPISRIDPTGGEDGDAGGLGDQNPNDLDNDGFSDDLFSTEFDWMLFDSEFNHDPVESAGTGAHLASGNIYSNAEQLYDALKLWSQNNFEKNKTPNSKWQKNDKKWGEKRFEDTYGWLNENNQIKDRWELVLFSYWKKFLTFDETSPSTLNADGVSSTYTRNFTQSGRILVTYNHYLMGASNLPGAGATFNGNITTVTYGGNTPQSSAPVPTGGPGVIIVGGATNARGNALASRGSVSVWGIANLNGQPTGDQFLVNVYYRKEVSISIPIINTNGNGLFSKKNKNKCFE